MGFRISLFFAVLAGAQALHAQTPNEVRYALHAQVFCQYSRETITGVLIKVTNESGFADSLVTDEKGVARTAIGKDTLSLPFGQVYNVEVRWPAGPVELRDRVAMDSFSGSTTFVKEYYIRNCTDPRIERWRPPSIYFPENSSSPRTDSVWYQQEAQVNSVDEAVTAIVEVMADNPTIILMVRGYCNVLERDSERLALDRATWVREKLVKRGVPAERLQVEGRGADNRYLEKEIASMTDPREREIALAHDRYVGYLVVGFTDKP